MKIADHIKDNISFREWCREKYKETGNKAWKDIGDALKDEIVDDLGLQYRIENPKRKNHAPYYIDEYLQYKKSQIRWLNGCKTCGKMRRVKGDN
jgi:hypothetical protein